jgi:Na+/phosphate symporter
MMVTALIPFVIAAVGAVLYLVSTRAELKEIGRLVFAAGMFALAFSLAAAKLTI